MACILWRDGGDIMRHHLERIGLTLVVLVLTAIIGLRISGINKDRILTVQEDYKIGEEVILGDNTFDSKSFCDYSDYSVTVEGYEILTYEKYLEKYQYEDDPDYPFYTSDNGLYPEMVYDVELTFRNLNDQENPESGINMFPYKLYGTDFWMDTSDLLYQISNPIAKDVMWQFMLRPGTSMSFHVPFYFQPSAKQWAVSLEKCMQDDIYLVVSEYPVRKVIHLQQ